MSGDQDTQVAELFKQIARSMSKGAPQGYRRATLNARLDRHGVSGRVTNVLAGGRARFGPQDFERQLTALRDLIAHADGEEGDGGEIGVVLGVEPGGRFEAVTGAALGTREGPAPGTGRVLHVLRPEVPPPDPGDDQPGPPAAAPASSAPDPGEAVRVLHRYLAERAQILGSPDGDLEWLPTALEAAEIEHLERALGTRLPDDLRALYGAANGDGGDDGARLMDRHPWFDLPHLVARYHGDPWWKAGTSWRHHRLHAARHDPLPHGTVRRSVRRAGWIPFAESTGGDFLAVDMDPAERGRPGQVIRIGRDHDTGPVWVAESVTALLGRHVEACERGDYGTAGGELRVEARLPRRSGAVRHSGVRDAAASLDQVQELAATGEADLEPLRGARRLRYVRLAGAASVDLAPLRDVPVESLELDLGSVDLAPLEGHPTLRAVTVASARPLSAAPLRSCPRLYGLDLSQAPVHDVEVTAGMAGLLFLALRHDQWSQLWARTGPVPSPAAAELCGGPSPGQVAQWAARLDPGGGGLRHHAGRLEP